MYPLLDGMPFEEIGLAAAWGPDPLALCQEIAEEIERNLEFPAVLWPDMPERHHSLHAVFEHSWSLLSSEERRNLVPPVCLSGWF